MILPKNTHFSNIILIGMAGAGKSTIGPLLAERLSLSFVDSDDLIADAHTTSLQKVLDSLGVRRFQALEEQTLLAIDVQHCVIATGGSAVYSRAGMEHLQAIGLVVWLDTPLAELEARVKNLNSRGLINPNGTSFAELYHQRLELYKKYTGLRIDCSQKNPQQIADTILQQISQDGAAAQRST